MSLARKGSHGFTIVELLIVVVVIAILATIAVVAFNGVTQRARNTSRVAAASQVIKTLKLYAVENSMTQLLQQIPENYSGCYGKNFPDVNGDGVGDCIYASSAAIRSNLPSLDALLETTGSYSKVEYSPVTYSGLTVAGITITNFSSTIDGRQANLQLRYYLEGDANTACGVDGVLSEDSSGASTYTKSGAKNTFVDSGFVACVIDLSEL